MLTTMQNANQNADDFSKELIETRNACGSRVGCIGRKIMYRSDRR